MILNLMIEIIKRFSNPYFILSILLIFLTLFYYKIFYVLDNYKLSIPLTFSHHIFEYLFFFNKGYGLCNPFSTQGRQWIRKEKFFFTFLLIANLLILIFYYRDIEKSENLYNSFAIFHCFSALFFFWDYFKGTQYLKSKGIIIGIILLSGILNYLYFYQYYSELSEWFLAFSLDIHLLIWLVIFIYGIKRQEIKFTAVLVILFFWIFYFSPWGWVLDYSWIFFSFNHITFEAYVLVTKKNLRINSLSINF